jgi:hypothetical protein
MADGRADRIAGALLGGACGDALGVPYEFGSAPLRPGEVPRHLCRPRSTAAPDVRPATGR